MFFFHVLLLQHGCSENTPYDFFKRKLSLVGGDNRGHLHENIAPGAGTFTYFLQPISPSPRLCPGWGDRGFTLNGALSLKRSNVGESDAFKLLLEQISILRDEMTAK